MNRIIVYLGFDIVSLILAGLFIFLTYWLGMKIWGMGFILYAIVTLEVLMMYPYSIIQNHFRQRIFKI